MESERETGRDARVATRPHGANGIPEVFELDPRAVRDVFERPGEGAGVPDTRRRPTGGGSPAAGWVAVTAVVGGALGAIVGYRRSRSHGRAPLYPPSDETRPHGDKLLPRGQHRE